MWNYHVSSSVIHSRSHHCASCWGLAVSENWKPSASHNTDRLGKKHRRSSLNELVHGERPCSKWILSPQWPRFQRLFFQAFQTIGYTYVWYKLVVMKLLLGSFIFRYVQQVVVLHSYLVAFAHHSPSLHAPPTEHTCSCRARARSAGTRVCVSPEVDICGRNWGLAPIVGWPFFIEKIIGIHGIFGQTSRRLSAASWWSSYSTPNCLIGDHHSY